MKIQKMILPILLASVLFTACESDDDNKGGVEEVKLSQQERNQVDDEAIKLILNDYYLNDQGKLTEFSDSDASDDNRTPLAELATYHPQGYWTVKRADYTSSGRKVTDVEKDKILLQYDMFTFQGKTNTKKDSIFYSKPVSYSSTINGKGYPIADPDFYYKTLTEQQKEQKFEREWYQIEGFQEGIKEFNSADKALTDLPHVDFQGLIIIPSRLAFGRDKNALGFSVDQSIIVNFELYKVEDR